MTHPLWTVSIVSHGHRRYIEDLLVQLARECGSSVAKVVITWDDRDEAPPAVLAPPSCPFPVESVVNVRSQGFAENHNAAFSRCDTPFFAVVNPDIALSADPFPALTVALQQPNCALAYPHQRDERGHSQDYERRLPQPVEILRRLLARSSSERRDWVSGAFMGLRADAFRDVGGFDNGFRLYCEDVDLCLRLQLRGWALQSAKCEVLHYGNRASHRSLQHTSWHVQSLFRLWLSQPYREYRRQFP